MVGKVSKVSKVKMVLLPIRVLQDQLVLMVNRVAKVLGEIKVAKVLMV